MLINQNTYFYAALLFLLSLSAAVLVTGLVRKFALKHKIGEEPGPRKVHQIFMPHMGGFGIFAGFISGVLLSFFFFPAAAAEISRTYSGLLIASVLIVGLGAYDDLKGLNAGQKVFGQFIIVTVLILSGCRIDSIQVPFFRPVSLSILAVPVSYLWLIGMSNAVNLLDGLDGLAAGFSAIAAAVIALIAWQFQNSAVFVLSLALVAGSLGFLRYNYHPAKIFMGDTGSLFLGLMLAVLSLKVFEEPPGNINLLLPLIILAIPAGDTAIAFFRRLNKGRHPFKPDKDHLHHRLIYLGLSHKQAVHIIYLASLVFALTAWQITMQSAFISAILLVSVLALSFLSLKRVGYLEARHTRMYFGDDQMAAVKKEIAPLSMRRFIHKVLFFISDALMINLSFILVWWIKYDSGLLHPDSMIAFAKFWATPLPLILTLFWLLLFVFNDLYSLRWDVSRFDHLRTSGKVILFGGVLLFLLTMEKGVIFSEGRLTLLIYIIVLLLLVSAGRIFFIQIEKTFSILEYAPHKALLVGTSEKGRKMLKDISGNPHLLYDFVGFVSREIQTKKFYGLDCLGVYDDIPHIIRTRGVEEVIIAINERSRDEILNIAARTENAAVIFKILPKMYDLISGHKSAEVIGHPLIRLFPDVMHLWQWALKRLLDIVLSAMLLLLLMPFFLTALVAQIIAGISPLFRIDNMIGKNGVRYGMLNLNTERTGLFGAVGRILYRTRFYKFPALLNILLGQMSFVGPRPEDEETAKELRTKIKFYNRRFQIRPGLTGWPQVRFRYEEALRYKKEQLKLDLYYLENMSLTFDLRIILRSVVIFFIGMKAK